MRKIILGFVLMLVTIICHSGYYDINHQVLVVDTTSITNDWYFRGDFFYNASTFPATIQTSTPNVIIRGTGTVEATNFVGDGSGITNISINNATQWNTLEVTTTSLADNDLLRYDSGTNKFVSVASGTSGSFLRADMTWNAPAGGGDMLKSIYDTDDNGIVDNSVQFATHTYAHYVNTATYQTIGGSKTWSDYQAFQSSVTISSDVVITGNIDASSATIDYIESSSGTLSNYQITNSTITSTWQRIHYELFVASGTTSTVTGLSGDTDLEYKIIVKAVNDVGSNVYYFVMINEDKTTNNYGYQSIVSDLAGAGTPQSSANNTASSFYIGITHNTYGSFFSETLLSVPQSSYRRAHTFYSSCKPNTQAAGQIGTIGSYYTITNTEVTRLDIYADVTNGFGINSYVEVWVRR